jgi:cyclin-dependent kinase 12/13
MSTRRQVKEFTILRQCGKGSYSFVFEAEIIVKGKKRIVALKKMQEREFAEREAECLRNCRHINVIRIYDFFRLTEPEDKYPSYWLVLDWCDSTLHEVMRNRRLTMNQIKLLFSQLLHGLAHIHSKGILHLDIKPSNLLLRDSHLVIADFSISLRKNEEPYLQTYVSSWYRPPELIHGKGQYSFGVDMWSAACVFAEMVAGVPLFMANDEKDLLEQIDNRLPNLSQLLPTLDIAGLHLMGKMFNKTQLFRITAEEALKHPFFS